MSEQGLTIPAMPLLWDKSDIYVSRSQIAGAVAKWAVIQSPYTVPERLAEAIEEFMAQWPHEDFTLMASAAIREDVIAIIDNCPLIQAWNEPKVAGAAPHGFAFVSRYETIKPDYDFIDLGALAHNIAHELALWSQVEAAQDSFRESRHSQT